MQQSVRSLALGTRTREGLSLCLSVGLTTFPLGGIRLRQEQLPNWGWVSGWGEVVAAIIYSDLIPLVVDKTIYGDRIHASLCPLMIWRMAQNTVELCDTIHLKWTDKQSLS